MLSVIIPTHRRAKILARTLDHLERQTIREQMEVIVVSDGHDDATAALFRDQQQWTFPLRFFEVPKSQQGVARNRGVREAKGERVLFIGDDIFLKPNACEVHAQPSQSAIRNPQSAMILGFTTWDPELIITPLMRWLESSGWQFGYPMIEHYAEQTLPGEIQHKFTYTSHISLPTELARQIPFREDVTLYGWEDIEWGLRLKDKCVPLIYRPQAKAYHHHPMTLEQSLKRMETLGRSAVQIEAIEPRLNVVPKGWKLLAYRLAAMLPTTAGKHRKAFLDGILGPQHSQVASNPQSAIRN